VPLFFINIKNIQESFKYNIWSGFSKILTRWLGKSFFF